MGSLLWSAIIGLVVGALAKLIMPGSQGGGIILTMVLGIVGSLVATYAGQALGFYPPGANAGFIASVVGALIVLWIYGMVTRKKSGDA